MSGRDVFRFATTKTPEAMLEALTLAGLSATQLDLLIPHQANQRIIDGAARRLELPASAVFSNVARYGNTSSASVPVALCEAIDQGLVSEGSIIGMIAFGAGLSWAAAVWQWNS
jgi:3-oxoacyl-[acyl-carrier-protein] synthase-3